MNRRPRARCPQGAFLLLLMAMAAPPARAEEARSPVAEMLRGSGARTGIWAHLGCGDGRLMAELARQGNVYVHGLEDDQAAVDKARAFLQGQGLYDRAAVDRSSFRDLPYAENLLNVVVIDDFARLQGQGLRPSEILRVLVPNGVACVGDANAKVTEEALREGLSDAGIKDFPVRRQGGVWAVLRKPRPAEMDDWSHPRHAPDGNPVSRDLIAGPAQQLQWIAPPLWGHHRGPDGAVSAGGRLFYVLMHRPLTLGVIGRFYLTARDACNGKLLWERQVDAHKTQYSYAADLPIGAMVAAEDRLFVVLKPGQPLKALDGDTGKELMSYDEHPSPTHVLHTDGTLLLIKGSEVRAVDAESGKLLWARNGGYFRAGNVWTSTFIVAAEGAVFFQESAGSRTPVNLVAVDLRTGKEKWNRKIAELFPAAKGPIHLQSCYRQSLLVVADGQLYALAAAEGTVRWSQAFGKTAQVYGLRDAVWVGQGRQWQGLDPATGRPRQLFKAPGKLPSNISGKRILDGQCNFPLATERFFIIDTRMSLVDTESGTYLNSMFTRGPCKFLLALPANGLMYTFPKDCGCYPCLRGLLSYAPVRPSTRDDAKPAAAHPLEKGAAYGVSLRDGAPNADDWPMHRRDVRRGAASSAVVPGVVRPIWESNLGGTLSAPTVADGKVFVASVERHCVNALDEESGRLLWTFTAGGRVDSPPTIYKGLCVFGCRDGWVYCLQANDGTLLWRLRAAPYERRIGVWDQLESAWPVFGAVLVHNDVLYCSAGRHANAEGGILVHAIAPATGKILWTNGPTYEIVNNVLSVSSGGNIYLGYYKVAFDAKTGKAVRETAALRTHYAGMLTESAGAAWGGADLKAFDDERTVSVFSGSPAMRTVFRRAADVPGSGFEITMTRPQEGDDKPVWTRTDEPVRFNALALTRDVVFAAGGLEFAYDPKAENPWAFLDGDRGGKLMAYAAADGKVLGEIKLAALPVFDGLAAANGRLFLSSKDGKVTCFGGK